MPADDANFPRLALTPEPGEARTNWFDQAAFIVLGQEARRTEALSRRSGVRWSGMDGEELPQVQTVEAVALDLERKAAKQRQFEVTPRGRFIVAVNSLGSLGYGEADTLLNIYGRTLADPDAALDERHVEAIGRAIRVLNGIAHSHAKEAIGALADLLAPELKAAA